jgi:hypothetical protein
MSASNAAFILRKTPDGSQAGLYLAYGIGELSPPGDEPMAESSKDQHDSEALRWKRLFFGDFVYQLRVSHLLLPILHPLVAFMLYVVPVHGVPSVLSDSPSLWRPTG